jgi:hypothetical protein
MSNDLSIVGFFVVSGGCTLFQAAKVSNIHDMLHGCNDAPASGIQIPPSARDSLIELHRLSIVPPLVFSLSNYATDFFAHVCFLVRKSIQKREYGCTC